MWSIMVFSAVSSGSGSRSVLVRRRPPCSVVSSAVARLSILVPGRNSPRSDVHPNYTTRSEVHDILAAVDSVR